MLVLDRPRHAQLIKEIRAAGARIRMISDGDVSDAVGLVPLGAAAQAWQWIAVCRPSALEPTTPYLQA